MVQRLHDTPDLVTIYRASKIGYGVFFGGGGILATGPLAQTIRSAGGVVFGIDIAFQRTMLMLHPTLYNGTLRQGFSHQNQTWEKDMPISPMLFEAGLGRIVHDGPRTRIIPYLGYLLFDLSPRDRKDERYQGLSLLSHAPTAGLAFDIKLGNNAPKNDRTEVSFWFIRTKLSYSPILDDKPFSGGLINLQIGLGGFGRIRKVGYKPEPTTITLPGSTI